MIQELSRASQGNGSIRSLVMIMGLMRSESNSVAPVMMMKKKKRTMMK
jgi:hypothetical protein